ncbi:dinitrogenase iron-molybdenum cofactor biosynthesis protein [Dechloromonas sp. XY25]|uniref:Dinitrogenase iron-molybdenum cofactor biosynthesis protein n=1 Tax=Dechloromonas hankyongensis TaxID=2908002 RepID=A0ABS9K1E2_9RHOO|nr:dinitrogenase iron-molybdenum cofactor N-terminal domain-containing protein [Dechloromonas hankyongensis]MCG2576936.1 dinitrogenase iron-molybdenum cofactor biosynthesis protein [Dechloromonas hankyongensis]
MSPSPIASREAALRIALAARALNGLDVKAFVGALLEKLEPPLTEAKLGKLTVEDLRVILAGDFAEQGCHVGVEGEQLKEAVRMLWGQGIENGDFPVIEAYADGEMPGSIRVAVAANRGENLDGHFGSCDRFLIYQVGQQAIKLIDVRSTAEADGAEDKNAARSALINDCQIVYIQSIGGPAAAKVVRAGVHPVKKPTGGPAREALLELQGRLSCPPPWLAQIMGVPSASLARFEEELENEEAA